ncbi:HupE/UreJ family protein [Pedobacter aquatilis]|uniref:HupE/UreJ family protein n=1 Tax=Pedobacter aquatilis TaxID=351343 RepID=UPI002930A7FD|nr:HupE/UreJ family protein [Pedobacter aquatilis]
MDVSPDKVSLEVQLPITELELAFGQNLSKAPEQVLADYSPQLREYLLAHIHAYTTPEKPWLINVTALHLSKGNYVESNIPYWELVAIVEMRPQSGENTRDFYLDYDAIMHQVINHSALANVRNDWENGKVENYSILSQAISWDLASNKIAPFHVVLGKGSNWQGFKSLVVMGMRHIYEGTDHLMFLLVLLLPSTQLFRNNKWEGFKGTRKSLISLLKITSAFTIGHSITLLLAALNWVRVPAQPIEILIAISILISAIHAMKPVFAGKEVYIAAGFGLIHGLAFAATLVNLNLDATRMIMSILAFNVGIEFMQLFIISIIIPWLLLWSTTISYRFLRLFGATIAIIAATGWIIQRISYSHNFVTDIMDKTVDYTWYLIAGLAVLSVVNYIIFKKVVKRKTVSANQY